MGADAHKHDRQLYVGSLWAANLTGSVGEVSKPPRLTAFSHGAG